MIINREKNVPERNVSFVKGTRTTIRKTQVLRINKAKVKEI